MFRVLVIAKDITIANLASLGIKNLKFAARINYALSATQALYYLTSIRRDPEVSPPDVILLFDTLPDAGGADAVRAFKKIVGDDPSTIIVVSSKGGPETKSEFERRGAAAIVDLPEDLSTLPQEIAEVVRFVAMLQGLIPKQPQFLPPELRRPETIGEILQVHL